MTRKKKLKLPIIKNMPESDRWLSMDDYVKFVTMCSECFPREKDPEEELRMRVNVRFSL